MPVTRTLLLLVACLLSFGEAVRAAQLPIAGDPIKTQSGEVAGTRLPSGVHAYLGVPYAQPPVRDRRWAAPRRLHWDGVWNADRTGPECPQILRPHTINHYFGEEPTGEDCLYLNLWTPASASASSKLPIIVFIHGGGGTVGSSGMSLYGGEAIAARGAIFVNFNYRLGILGFMAHPDLSREQGGHSGNYGYLDQVAALQWIHDNIAAFGGDPAKVIITGQSFGATSVAAQLFSPLAKGLFRGAAMWSACSFATPAVPLQAAEAIGADVQRRLGAGTLEGLRDLPADKILGVQEEHQLGANVQGVRLPPTLDGLFWTADKAAVLQSGGFNDVPIIAGSNADDLDLGRSPLTEASNVAGFRERASTLYGARADEFLRLFSVRSNADVSPAAHRAAQESGFLGQSAGCAAIQVKYNRSPAYLELFAHPHSYEPGVHIADQNTATVGAYHTADVPFWFDTLSAFNAIRPTRRWTDADRRLADLMSGALIAFAETGNPSSRALSWPAWSPKSPRLLVLRDEPVVETMDFKRIEWLTAHPPAELDSAGKPRLPRD
jgi:para-nitrobenzyl esterase